MSDLNTKNNLFEMIFNVKKREKFFTFFVEKTGGEIVRKVIVYCIVNETITIDLN